MVQTITYFQAEENSTLMEDFSTSSSVEGVLDHVVIYQDLPPAPEYRSSAEFDPRGMEHVYLIVNTFLDLIVRQDVLPESKLWHQFMILVKDAVSKVFVYHWSQAATCCMFSLSWDNTWSRGLAGSFTNIFNVSTSIANTITTLLNFVFEFQSKQKQIICFSTSLLSSQHLYQTLWLIANILLKSLI